MSVPRRPGARQALAALAGAAVTVALVVAPGAGPGVAAAGVAPGAPGTASDWVPGDKDAFGTARGTASKVWYTASRGTLNEVYYPRIDTPSLRDSQFVVTDGSTFTDREDRDATHQVQLLSPDSLTYRLVNTAKSGAWRITKTFVTDPARSTVLEDVRFESLTGKEYQVYLLHDVALSMTGNDDTGRSGAGGALLSSDGSNASAVVTSPALGKTSSGYLGTSDGWTDLATDHDMDWSYDATTPGNVVQAGPGQGERPAEPPAVHRVDRLRRRPRAARCRRRRRLLGAGFSAARTAYDKGWAGYLGSLDPVAGLGVRLDDRVEGVGHGPRRQRGQDRARRLRRRPEPALGLGELVAVPGGLPRRLVPRPLPDRHRAARGRRRRGGEPGAGLPLERAAAAGRLLPAELQAGRRRRCSATCRWTRWRSRSCWRTSSAGPARPTGTT